jgi:hypothetical protein
LKVSCYRMVNGSGYVEKRKRSDWKHSIALRR